MGRGAVTGRAPRRTSARSMAAGSHASINTGAAVCGPRRLNTSTDNCPLAAARHNRRSGAGEDSWRATAGRNTKLKPSPAPAANCRRRRWSGLACGSQHSKAPKLALLSICSAAHRRSPGLSDCTSNSRRTSTPACARAGAKTWCGGASKTMVSPAAAKRDNRGANRRNSPSPCCAHSNSVNVDGGQPPPGNSRSSTA